MAGAAHRSSDRLADGRGRAELLRLVDTIGDAGSVRSCLAWITADPSRLARFAAHAVDHPLGFRQLVLGSGPDHQVRLHYWRGDGTVRSEEVHDHRFSFASAVVHGSLVVESFDVAEHGPVYQTLECGTASADAYTMRDSGAICVVPTRTVRYTAGERYHTGSEELHRVGPGGPRQTVTVIIKIRAAKESARVLATPGAAVRSTDRRELSPAGYRETAAELAGLLG